MADGADDRTEATTPERRRVLHLLNAVNVAFAFVDVAAYGFRPGAGMAGRALLSAALAGASVALGRALGARVQRAVVILLAALGAIAFGLIAADTGGGESPYLGFLVILPIVLGIVVPDEPWASVASGAAAAAFGLPLVVASGARGPRLAFLALAFASSAAYAALGAGLYRRMRRRERAAAAGRARALSDLAASERRRLESERLAAVGRLASGVAHEINNPLTFVGANLRFAREALGAAAPREVASALDEAGDGVERMRQIVEDLRGLARRAPDEVAPTDLARTIDEAGRLAALRLRPVARVEVHLAPGLPPVRACARQLVQVLVNLLVNAADAVEEDRRHGGRPEGRIAVHAAVQEDAVAVAVEDTGPGIPKEALAQLFEPFFTTKGANGTGLGLALSREFVEQWGGAIRAENLPGGGARFVVFLLPATPIPAAAVPATAA